MSLRKAARAIRRAAADETSSRAPRPERFRVTRTDPLELTGLDTDVLLNENDEDVEIHAPVARAALKRGDVVVVQPHPDANGSTIAAWHATHVASADAEGVILGGVYTLATRPASGRSYEIIMVTNAAVGQRWQGWDGGAWRPLG